MKEFFCISETWLQVSALGLMRPKTDQTPVLGEAPSFHSYSRLAGLVPKWLRMLLLLLLPLLLVLLLLLLLRLRLLLRVLLFLIC